MLIMPGRDPIASVHTALDDSSRLEKRDLTQRTGGQRTRIIIIGVAAPDVVDSVPTNILDARATLFDFVVWTAPKHR